MSIVRYLVQDVSESISFYTKYFGFEVKENYGIAFAVLTKDDLILWISGPKTSAAQPMPNGDKPIPGGWNRIVITVTDIELTIATLKKDGIKTRNDILVGVGGKQIVIEDPSGNPIEIFEPK